MMKSKIFKSTFTASLLILLISFGLVFGILFNYFETQVFSDLQNAADYIRYGLETNGESYINHFKDGMNRITLIAPDGTVTADTSENPANLQNHSDRKEVIEAIKSGEGKSERYSYTLMQKNLYYATKLDNGSILRVSTTQNSVIVIMLGFLQPIIFVIVFALGISLFLSYKASNSIIKPINELNLDNPEENECYEELTPLLKKLSTQKKTIRRQIKEAEQRREEFNLIFENMSEGFLVIDKNANILSYNTSAVRLLGIDDTSCENVLTVNRTKGFINVIKKALDGKRAENNISVDNNIYNLIANPVCQSNKIIGAVIVIIDVTESIKREQLRREFTSNVSHELKTPLTSISGFAEMMKSGGTPEDAVIDFSASIYTEAQRLITLVSDIMKISELDEETISYDKQKVDLYELSKDIAERLKPVAERQNIALNIIGSNCCVLGSQKILDEMIYNLCDNAIKYNRENGTVDIILKNENDKILLTVKDSGIGIPTSEQSRIFERFYRVDKSRSKSAGGTGLGLAIVKHGAMVHNADIMLESSEGSGTSITISFNAV